MPITQDDIRFRASQRMTDFDDGGGRMSDVVIVDGQDNNVFDDVTDLEYLTGKLSLRKIFGAALNADQAAYLSAHVLLDDEPDYAPVSAFVFAHGGVTGERAAALAALRNTSSALAAAVYGATGGTASSSSAVITGFTISDTGLLDSGIGQWFLLQHADAGNDRVALRRLISRDINDLTFNAAPPWSGTTAVSRVNQFPNATADSRVYGLAVLPSGAAEDDTSVAATSLLVRVAPLPDGGIAGPGAVTLPGFGLLAPYDISAGFVPVFLPGDLLLVHHTDPEAPQTVSNAQTVDVGRTNLARLRVIGNNGTEHARYVAGQPDPAVPGISCDLAAGTVTFSDVSGLSQPVTIEHRIEEMAVASSVNLGTGVVGLNRGLGRTYPAGTKISSILMLGDLQGRPTNVAFAQQAWTGVWSDSRIGGEPLADFNIAGHPVQCTNAGAVTERWALIFTNTTSFRIVGEQLGEVGTGTTGAACEPLNPATGEPYFSVAAAGWGGGWAAGNVLRFNTAGANAPVWIGRCVAPAAPGGDDSVTPQLRGFVNT
ncbi:MAG: hypothetical protein KF683_11410 [Rubrivivax sp.]|nr:hypothetical protein [Rubrivivax sp.]